MLTLFSPKRVTSGKISIKYSHILINKKDKEKSYMQMEVSKEEARKINPSLITKIEDGNKTGLRATKKEYLKAVDKSYKIIKTEKNILDQIDTYDVYCEYDDEKFVMRAMIEVFR